MTEVTGLSETDGSNTSLSSIDVAEGCAPSGINDAIRAMSGMLARSYNRLTGKYASTGSANAYVVTPSVAIPAYVTGERYSFRSSFANTGSATVNISSLGAKTIKKMAQSGKANLTAGDIASGQPVTVEYDGTDMILTTPTAPKQIIQRVVSFLTAYSSPPSSALPFDDTLPLIGEGAEVTTVSITPKSATNRLLIRGCVWGAPQNATSFSAALFEDSFPNCLAANGHNAGIADFLSQVHVEHEMAAGITSAMTFRLRAGAPSGSYYFNGISSGRRLAGAGNSYLIVEEYAP